MAKVPKLSSFSAVLSLLYLALLVVAEEEEWQACEIFLAPSDIGWGVFAARSFRQGEIVDIAPGIIPMDNEQILYNSVLNDYVYGYWRISGRQLLQSHVVMFGMDMIYNHHPRPNLEFTTFGREPAPDVPRTSTAIGFVAKRDIAVGEQLFSSYGDDVDGTEWFYYRRMKMQWPKNSRILPSELTQYKEKYCSKIISGIGVPTWKGRILPVLPKEVPFSIDLMRLAPFDAGYGDARAKMAISLGDRIEIATSLIVSHRLVQGSALGAVVIPWKDMTNEHQQALRNLRDKGQLTLQYQGQDTNWKAIDDFKSFEDLAILPIAGFIGMVRRVGDDTSNCRLIIHSEATVDSIGVTLELIATKNISVGETLTLNLPQSGSREELQALKKEMKLTGMPHYTGLFSETNREL